MARETIYTVQSFQMGNRNRLRADAPIPCKSAEGALRIAQRLASNRIGVMAFSITGDAELGDYDDKPIILFRYGQIPDEI